MLTEEENNILDAYKTAIRQYCSHHKIVDLDQKHFNRLNFFIIRLEDALPHLKFSLPPHRQSQFVISFFTKGKGEILVGSTRVKVTKQTLLFIPGHTISSGGNSEDTKGYVLIFNLKFFVDTRFQNDQLQKMTLFRSAFLPYVHTGVTQAKTLQSIFETLLDERRHDRVNKHEMITLKILELLIHCERLFKKTDKPASNIQPVPLIEFINLLQKYYAESHSVSFYAQKLRLHPNTLNLLCKQHLQRSAKATIDLKVIAEAQLLLNNTTLTVKEIAYDLGFQSASHFFRFFKRHTGHSPLQYRNR